MSICNKYRTILRYDGSIPPLKCEQCIKDRRPAMSDTKPKDEDPEKLARLIASRVNGFGPASARKLVFRLRTLDNIINAEPADLDAIFGKGSIKSIHLRKYLDDPVAVERLREGLQAKPKDGE